MTIATVADEFFTGNHQKASDFLISHKYIQAFSKSRFSRRLHQIPESLWQFAFYMLAQVKEKTTAFLVDSFPPPVCKNVRIKRCRIYKSQEYRGYTASKKEYFYGLKVCLIVTDIGRPVELVLVPGSTHDCKALRSMDIDLTEQTILIGDKGFLDGGDLKEDASIHLIVPSRSNRKEQLSNFVAWIAGTMRKQVETAFSQLSERLVRSVHAVTPRGFELKVFLTVLTYAILR